MSGPGHMKNTACGVATGILPTQLCRNLGPKHFSQNMEAGGVNLKYDKPYKLHRVKCMKKIGESLKISDFHDEIK